MRKLLLQEDCHYPLIPLVVNVQNFKEAVLEYARDQGAPACLDTTCLPCSLAQFGDVASKLGRLDLDPWIRCIITVGVPLSWFGYFGKNATAISE
jgi:hypothetical protein